MVISSPALEMPATVNLVQHRKSLVKNRPAIYPFLFAQYPILALAASNINQMTLDLAIRSFVISTLACGILLLIGYLIFKDLHKSELITSLISVFFFTYGHLYLAIEGKDFLGIIIGRHRFLLPLWSLLFIIGVFLFLRTKFNADKLRKTLNISLLVLCSMPTLTISWHFLIPNISPSPEPVQISNNIPTDNQSLPDIYYIVLDSYTREDVLQTMFNYDNSPFLNELKKLDFYIADYSWSNYPNTSLSISSSLNMNYINEIIDSVNPSSTNLTPVYDRIQNNLVFQTFEKMGYSTVAFETGYSGTELKSADLYMKPAPRESGFFGPPNLFEGLLIETSLARLVVEFSSFIPDLLKPDLSASYIDHYYRILYYFDALKDLPETDNPKIIFLHIISPHPPFVFDSEGELTITEGAMTLNIEGTFSSRSVFIEGYINQVNYLNKRLLDTIEFLKTNSKNPPIIILQADHGSGANTIGEGESPISYIDERFSILNVYYLPNCGRQKMYSTITPVNTFRFILKNCFSMDYELLQDRSFISNYTTPFDLNEIEQAIPED